MILMSIKSTFQKAFILYKETYIEMLPFVLMLVILEFFLNQSFQSVPSLPVNEIAAYIFADTFINSLFLGIVLKGMQFNLNQDDSNYLTMAIEGAKRSFSIFGSFLIISVPIIISFVIAYKLHTYQELEFLILFLSIIIPLSYAIVVGVFLYISPFLIANKNLNALEGIKTSFQLTRKYWLITFQILFSIVLIMGLVQFLCISFIGKYGVIVTNLLTFSFWCALMTVHGENLLTANREGKTNG